MKLNAPKNISKEFFIKIIFIRIKKRKNKSVQLFIFLLHKNKIIYFKKIVIAIAANKSDMYEIEEVEESQGRDCAKDINAIFKYTSAKNNIGIEVINNKQLL